VRLLADFLTALSRLTGSYGAAIVLLSVLVRMSVLPLVWLATRSLKTQLIIDQQLRDRYRHDQFRHAAETLEAYKRFGVHPLRGLHQYVPRIIVFVCLYRVLARPARFWSTSGVLESRGVDLTRSALQTPTLIPLALSVGFVLLRVVEVVRLSRLATFASVMARFRRFTFLFVLVQGVVAVVVPVGCVVYLVAGTVWSIVQQELLERFVHVAPFGIDPPGGGGDDWPDDPEPHPPRFGVGVPLPRERRHAKALPTSSRQH
jgi:membrane protein insertase Oxa1/YidC/SpoIIIJ